MTTIPSLSFFALRALSPNASEIHLVGGAWGLEPDHTPDALLSELAAFVRSCLEVIGPGAIEITRLERGICISIDDALLDVIKRQSIPRLHDSLAGWVRYLYPGLDLIWSPQ